MPNGMIENGGIAYVVAAYVITWVVLGALLVHAVGSARRARAEYDQAVKGGYRS